MDKAKEILYKHAKSNGCKSDLLRNPFLEQAVLNAINEALTTPIIVKRSSVCDRHDFVFKRLGTIGRKVMKCKKCGFIPN